MDSTVVMTKEEMGLPAFGRPTSRRLEHVIDGRSVRVEIECMDCIGAHGEGLCPMAFPDGGWRVQGFVDGEQVGTFYAGAFDGRYHGPADDGVIAANQFLLVLQGGPGVLRRDTEQVRTQLLADGWSHVTIRNQGMTWVISTGPDCGLIAFGREDDFLDDPDLSRGSCLHIHGISQGDLTLRDVVSLMPPGFTTPATEQ